MAMIAHFSILFAPIIVQITEYVTDLQGCVYVTLVIMDQIVLKYISLVPIIAQEMECVTDSLDFAHAI